MIKNSHIPALAVLLFITFTACKKGGTDPVTPTPPVVVKPGDTTVAPPVVIGRVLNLGNGSGDLTIDGKTLSIQPNDLIKIKGGVYTSISIRNINASSTVNVQNDGLVEIAGSNDHILLTNISNLTISGTGTPGISRGFVSRDNAQHRSIIITGAAQNLTIQNFAFKNIGDYVIYFNNAQGVYNGTKASFSDQIHFLNIDCDNTGTFLQMQGGVDNGVITGLVRNLEIAYLNFQNSDCGAAVIVDNADGYNIHHNTVNNINSNNNNHNGIFTVKGTGSFHHNLIHNHQGNALRAWVRSLGSTPKQVLIYNNTVVNSRKYSAFETQSFQNEIISGVTTYANCKVYSNICGDLNLSKDWVGVVVDVYNLFGGTCDVYNNTGFNFPAPSLTSNIVNQQSVTVPTATNNVYYPNAASAGIANTANLTIQP
ncbi:hypothetical protein HDF26_000228 [Pedobacter cryoconitis]|uniref:hypothetical protein n=1 Tax=Pedobacter cryoconitis TaxID=188932 RepID=UPI0016182506|nr:hypothetical protein [Pedobacter cryoconitis]MBB6269801.1 hypothetical protein [Pedobacter cryoconitis]